MNSTALIWRDLTSHKPNPEVRRTPLLETVRKASEAAYSVARRPPKRGFRSISPSLYRPNSRSQRWPHPFSDSFSTHSGEYKTKCKNRAEAS
jgi:hypothetical protein